MNRLFLKLATTLLVRSVLYSTPGAAQESPTTKKAAIVQITQGPEIERADPDFAIIRWTPIRLNPDHEETVFRVRMEDLAPRTTYYYKVDSMEANGKSDGVESPVKHFTTP